MPIETLDDAIAWLDALQPGGVTCVDNAELGQVLRLLFEEWQTVAARTAQHVAWLAEHDAWIATHDARLAAIRERLTAIEATYAALQAAEDDLDIFQAGYERGYAQGFKHAHDAQEDKHA